MMNTDVVVIGSGGAGLISAISALKEGVSVTIMSKTPSGTASSTAYSSGYFTFADGEQSFTDYVKKTIDVGRNINNVKLVKSLGKEAYSALKELESWGITLRFLKDGHATVRDSSKNPIVSGVGLISELKALASQKGVRLLDNVYVTEIIIKDNLVWGVEYCDWTRGTFEQIRCKAVILATGGAGQIYERTDNPSRITGDGYALALKTGLSLVDMEFIQFYPFGIDEPGFPSWMVRLPIIDLARVTDEENFEFLKEQMQIWGIGSGKEISLYARDRTAKLVQETISQGKQVLLHLEDIEREKWDEWDQRKILSCFPNGVRPWDYGPIHISPLEHYFCGGICIDEHSGTSIDGLFACGEVTGGVDGASRIGGNALSNVVSFAIKAGKHSASISSRTTSTGVLPNVRRKNFNLGNNGVNPRDIRAEIKTIAQKHLGPLRKETNVIKAISKLEGIYENIPDLRIEKPLDILLALELEGLLLSAMAVARCALFRKESRGVHSRIDFPSEVLQFEKTQSVKMLDDKLLTSFEK